jgi:hypothetical protein
LYAEKAEGVYPAAVFLVTLVPLNKGGIDVFEAFLFTLLRTITCESHFLVLHINAKTPTMFLQCAFLTEKLLIGFTCLKEIVTVELLWKPESAHLVSSSYNNSEPELPAFGKPVQTIKSTQEPKRNCKACKCTSKLRRGKITPRRHHSHVHTS